MAFDPTPWAVDGGPKHTGATARAQAYAANSGAEGVAGIYDLKVQAQDIPSNKVRILPGNASILNRYAGGSGQMYSLRNATATDVQITATGSSGGRTDMVVARILDPQYEGSPPSDPSTFEYARPSVIEGVSASVKTAKELNLGYPAIALARITIPTSTATITNSMITNLRRSVYDNAPFGSVMLFPTAQASIPTAGYSSWPITADQRPKVFVPEWATKVCVEGIVTGIKYSRGTGSLSSTAGTRTGFGGTDPAENGIMVQDPGDSGNRTTYVWLGTHVITAAMRGTEQFINLQAVRSQGDADWRVDYQSQISIKWTFTGGTQ